jgi:F-type H+-transporting ATPase subunit gamma
VEQLASLRARIGSLHELRNVIYAMRGLAVARAQQAQASLGGTRAYCHMIEDAIGKAALLLSGGEDTGGQDEGPGRSVTIVICSEHGFVGAYNEMLIGKLQQSAASGREIGVVGRRGAVLARELGVEPAWEVPMATHVTAAASTARRIVNRLATAETISVICAIYRAGGRFEIEERPILPLDPRLLERSDAGAPPLHHLEPLRLLARLSSEYVLAEMLHAIMEALTSENIERLSVMRSAEDTIDDRLERLGAREHVLRQEEITNELLDIVTGAEAAGLNDVPSP